MRDERTFLWLQKKLSKGRKFRCVPSLWHFFKISVGDFGGKNKYISTWKGWSWQNSPSRPFENTSWCWTGSTSWKIFLWTKNSFFLLALNTNPLRQEADRWSKITTFCNSSEIDAILAWAAKWWMLLSVTRVVNALPCSDKLYCPLHQSGVAFAGATNTVNTRQSEAVTVSLFFPPHHPHVFNPISPTHGHFVLSPVSLASRDQDGGPSDSTIDTYDLTEK